MITYRIIDSLLVKSVANITSVRVPNNKIPYVDRTSGVRPTNFVAAGLMEGCGAPFFLAAYHL